MRYVGFGLFCFIVAILFIAALVFGYIGICRVADWVTPWYLSHIGGDKQSVWALSAMATFFVILFSVGGSICYYCDVKNNNA